VPSKTSKLYAGLLASLLMAEIRGGLGATWKMPARIITEDELRAIPPQWKTFGTLYTPGYRTNWGQWHLVRELFQNALDEHDELGIIATPVIDYTPEGIVIKDYGRGLGVEGLLFKERKVTGDLRGTFGEGLKIACNTALRLGYDLQIESPMRSIEAVYVRRRLDGEELELYFIAKPQKPGVIGTTISIKGYTGPLFTNRFTQFIPPPLHTRAITIGRFTRQNAILSEPPNRLYIRDIYVRDLSEVHPSRFSYNIWEIEPDPDRDAERSTSDLHRAIACLWATVDQPTLIRQFLEDTADSNRFEYHVDFDWGNARRLLMAVRPIWQNAWMELYGRNAVLRTEAGWAKVAEMYGYRPIEYPWSLTYFLGEVVPTDKSVSESRVEELKKPRPVPLDELTPDQRKHLEALQWLHSQVEFPNSPPIIIAVIPPDPRTGETARGLYSTEENTIYIQRRELDLMRDTIEVYVHEMGHFISGGAIDGTREHVDGIQRVSAIITRLLTERPSHPVWADIIWE